MNFCFKLKPILCCLTLSFAAEGTELVKHTRSVVRADARGRLVRAFVVAPRIIPSRVVAESAAPPRATAAVAVPEIVEAAARKYDVDPLLVHSVIQVESNYNQYAVSPKGALGLMQLMPGTARRFGVSNPFDVQQNIEGGVRYLKYLNSLFPDERLALAAYNAGEGAVWKYNHQIPPYRETEQYVYKVGLRYGQAKRARPPQPVITETAVVASAPIEPAGPVYAPVQYRVDEQGRLHMQTTP